MNKIYISYDQAEKGARAIMRNDGFQFRVRRSTVVIFWLVILAIFLGIYFFAPSLFNQMRQVSYQNTPYVDTPLKP